jgi:hypothetical protein
MMRRLSPLVPLVLAFALALAPGALAGGGSYVLDGGTRAEQAQVRAALNASSFNWGLVPGPVLIHIAPGGPHAQAGAIWLDPSLLDSGRFSWGVVQHEYAHQVDFLVLDDAQRLELHALLGGASWWSASHAASDAERFADALAWAYWPSAANVMRPDSAADEGGQASPARFRSALATLLAGAAERVPAAAHAKGRTPKG